MLRMAAAGVLVGLLSACATSHVPLSEAKPVAADRLFALQQQAPGTSKVIVTRDSGAGGGGCDYGFYVDGQLAGKLATSETATFYVPLGERLLGTSMARGAGLCSFHGDPPNEIAVTLRADQAKYFRLGHNGDNVPFIAPTSLR
ncbi:hypothetical protein [Cupriavidus oxalaticus]|uniref:hypothetical protein n=1 Tax=Cupriavidus oxalaticus TaxID=96344 RepID=UPI0031762895